MPGLPLTLALCSYLAPGPWLPAQRSRPLQMNEKRKVADILQELDDEMAAYSELKASNKKTAAAAAAAEAAAAKAAGRVTAFGARLDDDVAGNAVLDKNRIEKHEQLFEAGTKLMRKGEYKGAVTAFTQAVAASPGGMTNRKGGQYAIYLAEALQAAGRKQDAVGLLKRCEAHPDSDVRKIADNVLYIMNAPELKIDADQFMTMEAFQEDDWTVRNRRRQTEDKDPPPEKYSLEWYALEGEKNRLARERAANLPDKGANAGTVAAALLFGTVGLGLLVQSGIGA